MYILHSFVPERDLQSIDRLPFARQPHRHRAVLCFSVLTARKTSTSSWMAMEHILCSTINWTKDWIESYNSFRDMHTTDRPSNINTPYSFRLPFLTAEDLRLRTVFCLVSRTDHGDGCTDNNIIAKMQRSQPATNKLTDWLCLQRSSFLRSVWSFIFLRRRRSGRREAVQRHSITCTEKILNRSDLRGKRINSGWDLNDK